jgi:urease accessory protein
MPLLLHSEDISANMGALEDLQAEYNCDLLFVECVLSLAVLIFSLARLTFSPFHRSGGDNLAANYSRTLSSSFLL